MAKNTPATTIDDLPEGLLIHILSFLPTKRAVATTVLSKRWQGLWAHAPALDFEIRFDPNRRPNSCRNKNPRPNPSDLLLIEKAMALHRSPKVTRFRLSATNIGGDVSEYLDKVLDSLVRSAVERHVEDLTFVFDPDKEDPKQESPLEYYAFPELVYTCGSLRDLKTRSCEMLPVGGFNWNSLRVLDVDQAMWSDDVLAGLLAGCPALESLRLRCFTGIRRVDVAAAPSNLKELVLESCLDPCEVGDEYWTLCICAPGIKKLVLSGTWKSHYPELIDVGSVVKADLDFEMPNWDLMWNVDIVKKLIEMVRQSAQLTIGPWFSQILTLMVARPDSHSAAMSSLESLVMMDIGLYLDHHLIGLYNLLQHTQNLERLVVRFGGEYHHRVDRDNLSDDATLRAGPPYRLLSNLKAVELVWVGASGRWCGFAKYLLKKLASLERMDIYPDPEAETESMLKLSKVLLSSPRCSTHAVVTFH